MNITNKGTCPLVDDWRTWDIFHDSFWALSPENAETFRKANAATLGPLIREIRATWELAVDSDPHPTPPKSFKKSHHFHADFNIDDHVVHIDKVSSVFFGPLRGYTEYRIYVDGVFVRIPGESGQ